MRIQINDLPNHLSRDLAGAYFVFGDEPLQQQEALELIRAQAKNHGYTERVVFEITPQFDWELLKNTIATLSLFSEKRLIECRLMEGKIGKTGADALSKLGPFFTSTPNTLFLFSAQKIDHKTQQANWFITLERLACSLQVRPLTGKEAHHWLEKRVKNAGFQISEEAIALLYDRTEGNLLAAAQTIEKLQLSKNTNDFNSLTAADILQTVAEEARFSLFDLVDATLSGNAGRTSRILISLKNEGVDPILIVWAIAREVRTLITLKNKIKGEHIQSAWFRELGIWKHRESLVSNCVKRFSIQQLQQILLKAKQLDDVIKGRTPGMVWNGLSEICFNLCGTLPLPVSNNNAVTNRVAGTT